MPEDPKALLVKAQKQIAAAKDALAETERLQRLKTMLESEKKDILEIADPEDRVQMRKLGEIEAQFLVFPRRHEIAKEKQTAVIVPMIELMEAMDTSIDSLRQEEAETITDKIAADIIHWFPKTARTIAASAHVFGVPWKCYRETKFNDPDLSQNVFPHPERHIPNLIRCLEERLLILAEYFANNRSFVPSGAFKGR